MKKNILCIMLLTMNVMIFAQESERSVVKSRSREECAESVSEFIKTLEQMNTQELNCFFDFCETSFNIVHKYLATNKLSLDKLSRFNNYPDVSQDLLEEMLEIAQEIIDGTVQSKINKKILNQLVECYREYILAMSEYFKTHDLAKKEKIKADLINILYSAIYYHIFTHSSTRSITHDHQAKKYLTIKKTHEIVYKNDTGEILDSYENTESYEHTELEED